MAIFYFNISITLAFCYLIIISIYIYYWSQLSSFEIPKNFKPQTKITLIIAARNEEVHLKNCIAALLRLDYPLDLLEIYLVDDHSTDKTAEIIQGYSFPQLHYLKLVEGVTGKKQAIAAAIRQSTGQLIVTTDADCIMQPQWLQYMASYYEKFQPKFIAAPVSFHDEKTIFEYFQTLDFMGMMAVSGAGVRGGFMNMCNGANLAYERAAFEAVNGFEGNEHLASGDDMLLMQKIAALYPNQIGYIKNPNCETLTYAKPTVKEFIAQRIRWTSKSSAYNWKVLAILVLVWLFCLSIFLDFFLMFYDSTFMYFFILKLFLKGFADFFFLGMMASFFNRLDAMKYFVPALFLHCWYIAWVGTLGNLVKKYEWKGREVH